VWYSLATKSDELDMSNSCMFLTAAFKFMKTGVLRLMLHLPLSIDLACLQQRVNVLRMVGYLYLCRLCVH